MLPSTLRSVKLIAGSLRLTQLYLRIPRAAQSLTGAFGALQMRALRSIQKPDNEGTASGIGAGADSGVIGRIEARALFMPPPFEAFA